MLLGTLGTSTLGNVIAGKGVIRAGKVVVRAGAGSNVDHMGQSI